MDMPEFAPGCFGSIIAFSSKDTLCQHCPFAQQCKPAHEERKKTLRAVYGIESPEHYKKQAVNPTKNEPILTAAPEADRLIEKLDKSNLDICGKLQRQINPFTQTGPKYLDLLCRLLLCTSSLISNDYLVAAFMQKFNWQQEIAKFHIRISIQALEHVGAIECVDGSIRLKQQE